MHPLEPVPVPGFAMQFIAPDILTEARGLTTAMTGTLCVLGIALWLFGWRWHRFWVVAGITLAAGMLGLNAGRAAGGTQIMAVGILLAVAAGMLALELAKVFAFVAGGCGAWLAIQWVFPQAQELWAVFLSGGLFGVLLYRLWTMLLTSLMGVLMAGHAALILLEQVVTYDAVKWVIDNQAAVNGSVVGLTVLGILLQTVASPDESEVKKEKGDEPEQKEKKKGEKKPDPEAANSDPDEKRDPWWRKLFPTRKAA
jgi:hypothetical protein